MRPPPLMTTTELRHSEGAVRGWIVLVIALVFAMVVVGGVTRLTDSGLSMVEWKPIMGAVPPLNDADWHAAFDAYTKYPQYRLKNPDMDLAAFKQIFFWEYVHRLLGRSIGLVFALPFAWFLWRGALGRPLAWKLGVALALGGMQGLVGWLMVASGLVGDATRVSHYRLTVHLGLAFAIMAWLLWVLIPLWPRRVAGAARIGPGWLGTVLVLALLQIVFGAFVAGLRAGWGYNTFPKMGDRWIPEAVMALEPWWRNFLHDNATVQFVHRVLGTLLLLAVAALWMVHRPRCSGAQRAALDLLGVLVLAQYALGVYTLVNAVPLVAAVMHQACAALLVLALVAFARLSRQS
jgi:cytochrome c oxidase assembly protein subunit 15